MRVLRWTHVTISSGSSVLKLIQDDGHSSQEHHVCRWLIFHLLYGHKWRTASDRFFPAVYLKHHIDVRCFLKGRFQCELLEERMTDTWATEVRAAGVFLCVRAAWQSEEQPWQRPRLFLFLLSSKTMDGCPKQISSSRPPVEPLRGPTGQI